MPVLADELVKLCELRHVPRISRHEGHEPGNPNVLLVETLAMVQCSACSGDMLRWRDRQSGEFVHQERFGYDATECEADHLLNAALKIGVQIYTGAELEFCDDET